MLHKVWQFGNSTVLCIFQTMFLASAFLPTFKDLCKRDIKIPTSRFSKAWGQPGGVEDRWNYRHRQDYVPSQDWYLWHFLGYLQDKWLKDNVLIPWCSTTLFNGNQCGSERQTRCQAESTVISELDSECGTMYADTTVTGDGPADVGNAPLAVLVIRSCQVDMFCFLHITIIYHLCSIAQRPVKRKTWAGEQSHSKLSWHPGDIWRFYSYTMTYTCQLVAPSMHEYVHPTELRSKMLMTT